MKTPNNLTDTENRLGVTRGRGQDEMCKGGQLNAMDGIRLPVVSSLWWTRSPVIMYGGNFNDVVNQCYLNKTLEIKSMQCENRFKTNSSFLCLEQGFSLHSGN